MTSAHQFPHSRPRSCCNQDKIADLILPNDGMGESIAQRVDEKILIMLVITYPEERKKHTISAQYCRLSNLKAPISLKFLFPYLIHPMSAKKKSDLNKMQSFLEVLKTFKFAAILVHRSRQSSLDLE